MAKRLLFLFVWLLCATSIWAALSDDFLNPHNAARSQLGLPPLVWDATLAQYADWWANERRVNGNCQLQHSNGPYGENIFWGGGSSWTPADAVNSFLSEKQYYDYASNTCQAGKQCGHYTQIVWRDTKRLGCARVVCQSSDVFITCNYDPPGNYIGQRPY
jgi:hypothetical protein